MVFSLLQKLLYKIYKIGSTKKHIHYFILKINITLSTLFYFITLLIL